MIFVTPVLWKDFRSSHQFSTYCVRLIVCINCRLVSHDNVLGVLLHIFYELINMKK